MPSITSLATSSTVLIESDWNLKIHVFLKCFRFFLGINRIRLEFKVMEGKLLCVRKAVLIESDWNLKSMTADPTRRFAACINRIRLELKLFLESDALCSCFS